MRKILTFILTFCIFVSVAVFTVSAGTEFTEGYYTYEVIDGKATITCFDESIGGDLIIPETLGGYPVTAVGDWAFAWCENLTSLSIPSSVTSIGYVAFRDCTNLESITVDEDNPIYHSAGNCLIETETGTLLKGCNNSIIPVDGSVTSIGERAFSGCDKIISLSMPESIASVAGYAFFRCENLTDVNFPESLTSIGDYTFYGCKSLAAVNLPDGVTSVGCMAFYGTAYYDDEENWETGVLYIGNHLIKAIMSFSGEYEIKDGTKTVAESAFEDCTSLTGVSIPDSVTSVGEWAFSYCTSLESVTVGGGVKSIGYYAFNSCNSLKTAYFKNPRNWSVNAENLLGQDLADPEKAAEFLAETYYKYNWIQDVAQSGDLDGTMGVDATDAVYLLYHVFFGDTRYPVDQNCDYDKNGTVEAADAIYLLYHVFFGAERYPLK